VSRSNLAVLDTAPADAAPQVQRDPRKDEVRAFARHCARFREANPKAAYWQIATTVGPFVATIAAMLFLAQWAWWAPLVLAIPAGGLLVRCFIIQHDCGHGSFLPSQKGNRIVGSLMSVLTFVPYDLWRREHALHHAGSGHLEKRGVGDIDTWTVDEYLSRPWYQRAWYRVYRNPLFLFGLGTPIFFTIIQRLPWFHGLAFKDAWKSVMGLNAALVAVYGALVYAFGFWAVLMTALPVVIVASAVGGWLFFIQHQFEEAYWEPEETWDFQIAAFYGSSYYVLPKVLQWFTGNIGLHHIHHLNSMVPNYRLQECMDALPALSRMNRLTLRESLACVNLTLWDPMQRRLIAFRDLPRAAAA
jgi:acyl-lipid omega-6 desaturase (Delta-12 desaturase)